MINLTAPINNLGYGIAGYNIMKELHKNNGVALYPIGQPEQMPDMAIVEKCLSNQQSVSTSSPSVRLWHQHELHHHVGKGVHVGFPVFELTKFSPTEVASMLHCDKIFVCSRWAKEIVAQNTSFNGDNIHVVPLGVDRNIFKEKPSSRQQTIFFNCGKWEVRKGHDVLVDYFNEAFNYNDNVELWMMCDNPFPNVDNQKWIDTYKSSPLGDKIRVIPRQKTQKDVYNIMTQTDCGIFPARAEGWNLELLEMMSCGKHVIATNYSGHTEFCTTENAHLINIDNLETAYDGVWFHGDRGFWAEISENQKDQTIEHMRSIYHKKNEGSLSPNTSGINTAVKFSWKNSANELLGGI
tara:strand:+ start:143 stop:1198 length:1056 start_codon:yes stop_codon:yes gene_type:complete